MRVLAVLAVLALAGCGDGAPEAEQRGDPIDCALAGAADFTPTCLYEFDPQASMITVRDPDGGFRRFDVLPGGAGVVASDGADEVIQGLVGGMLEVTVGDDRYRLPTKPVP